MKRNVGLHRLWKEKENTMSGFTCDQTKARDALDRTLVRMNPRNGFRRRLLDMFYETGTRWTWHTALGLLVLVPLRFMFLLFMGAGFVLLLPSAGAAAVGALLYDLGEDLAGYPSGWALSRYRKVLRDRDEITASGNTEP